MPFIRNKSIAITWTSRECQAVQLRAISGNTCEVTAAWHGAVGKEGASIAELVAQAARAVGADDTIYIIAGGSNQGWGMADITLPALSGEELRNALSFELHKQTPLPLEKLVWGYRILRKGNAAKSIMQRVRLFYVRSENWDGWMKAIGGLHHVDAMVAAPAALDPLMDGKTLTVLTDSESFSGYEYRSDESGRVIAPVAFETMPALAQLIPYGSELKLGALASRSDEEQSQFARAIVLAAYGLGSEVASDTATLPHLPERFRARRNIGLKISAICLGVYLLGMLAFVLAGYFQLKASQIRRVEQEIAKCKKELATLNKYMNPQEIERGNALRQELIDNTPVIPDFPTALVAVSRALPTNAWIPQALEWKEGKLSFQTQSTAKILELANILENSPYLGDVGERLSSFNANAGAYNQRFELTVRYDTDAEKAALKLQEEKERAARKEAAAKQKAEEAEDESDDDSEEESAGEEE